MKKILVLLLIGVMLLSTAAFAIPAQKGNIERVHDISDKVIVDFSELDSVTGDVTVTVSVPKIGSQIQELIIHKYNKSKKVLEYIIDGVDVVDWAASDEPYWGEYTFYEETQMYVVTFKYNKANMNEINVYAKFSPGKSMQIFEANKDFVGPETQFLQE